MLLEQHGKHVMGVSMGTPVLQPEVVILGYILHHHVLWWKSKFTRDYCTRNLRLDVEKPKEKRQLWDPYEDKAGMVHMEDVLEQGGYSFSINVRMAGVRQKREFVLIPSTQQNDVTLHVLAGNQGNTIASDCFHGRF